DDNGGFGVGTIVEAGILKLDVLFPIGGELTSEQALDDVHPFRKELIALGDAWPPRTHDMLVQALSRSETESEPVVAQQAHRRCTLRDDRRVVAHGGAGHGRRQAQVLRGVGHRSQHGPSPKANGLAPRPTGRNVRRWPRNRTPPARSELRYG